MQTLCELRYINRTLLGLEVFKGYALFNRTIKADIIKYNISETSKHLRRYMPTRKFSPLLSSCRVVGVDIKERQLQRHSVNNLHSQKCHLLNKIKNECSETSQWIFQIKLIGLAATLVNNSSPTLQPYLRLMRIDRPIGTWLLFWPAGWGIAMAANPGTLPDMKCLVLCGLGAIAMRSAGCIINDLWDKDIDAKVARTKNRPLVTGEVSQQNAVVLLAGLLSVALTILLQFNWYTVLLCSSVLGLVVAYPLSKRVISCPQFILGLTFNWGVLAGWSAVQGSCYWMACLPLYIAAACWTICYDTIYAHQDKADDLLIGIKSTAITFGERTKLWLATFGTTMIGGLSMSGINCDQTWPYYGSVGLVAAHLAYQIHTLDINNQNDCAQKFVSNNVIGFLLFLGIVSGTLLRDTGKNVEMVEPTLVDKDNLPLTRLSSSSADI